MASIQSILNKIASMANRTGLFSIEKTEFFGTLTDITNKVKEVNDNVNSVAKSLIWQSPVATFADLATTYPDAVQGWAAMVTSLGYIYSYNGSAWKDTGLKSFPEDVILKRAGKNLLQENSVNDNSYIYFEDAYGEDYNESYFTTKPIPIDIEGLHANKAHTDEASFVSHIYYNSSGQPIGHTKSQSIPFIEGASSVRFCFLNEKLFGLQIEKGLVETAYEPYSEIGGYVGELAQKGGSQKTLQQVDEEKLSALPGRNLFNETKIESKYIYFENGNYGQGASADYFITRPIPIDIDGLHVNKSHTDEASFVSHIYYNSSGQPIGHTKSQSIPFIEGASSVRFCFLNEKLFGLQIEKGLVETAYEPFSEIGGYVGGYLFDVEVVLPDKIHAIVGDTLQLFFRGMIKAVNPYNYDIVVNCNKGQMYPRYFEYTPLLSDVGTTSFTVKVKNNYGKVLAIKKCNLVTKVAVQAPATNKNVLVVGDSLTNARIYPVEAYRRLTQSGGAPVGLGYGNIAFTGRKPATYGIGVEGNSGWSWSDYLTVGRKAYTFAITAPVIMPAVEAVYQDSNGKQYTMWWDYSTTSVKMLVNDMVSAPPASGILTKISGTGSATITYSSVVQSSGNPFWDDGAASLNFTNYVNKWCGGSIDICYFLLTWNAQYGNRTDFSAFTNYARTLFNHIKAAYPNIRIKLLGVQIADLKQGMRVDGSPAENTYTDQYGLVVTALNMNKAYQDLANEPALSGFVEFVNVSSQVDSEYNMPYVQKAVNTRNATTEDVGTNDVHPNENGYNQIADVVFRNFIANFCQ